MTVPIKRPTMLRTAGPSGLVMEGTDGVLGVAPREPRQRLAVEPYVLVGNHLDAVAVMQAAIWRLLRTVEMRSIDLTKLLQTGRGEFSKPFRLERVFIDWPTQDDEIDPMPSVAIVPEGETVYENPSLGVQLIEETVDRFASGTVLRRLREAHQVFNLAVWSAHKEERRAIRAGFEDVFFAEPQDERDGRHVAVPEYFDQVVAIHTEKTNTSGDNEETAKQNRWVYEARLECDLEVVRLVGAPPEMRVLVPHPAIGPEIEP